MPIAVEDETGIANLAIWRELSEKQRRALNRCLQARKGVEAHLEVITADALRQSSTQDIRGACKVALGQGYGGFFHQKVGRPAPFLKLRHRHARTLHLGRSINKLACNLR